jgi:hypothetical protein
MNGGLMFMKGYKVFNPDWTCRGQKYSVSETYYLDKNINLYESGFHFCKNLIDCFNHYECVPENRYAEIEAVGKIMQDRKVMVTDSIKIIREIPFSEVVEMVNPGEKNIGYSNTGIGNRGNSNTGNWNVGNKNTGSMNKGESNIGDANIGVMNSGEGNFGDGNTGNNNLGDLNSSSHNSGNANSGIANNGSFNSGDCNSTDFSNGIFNSSSPKMFMFNKVSGWSIEEWRKSRPYELIKKHFALTEFVESYSLTDEEKVSNPEHAIIGGIVRRYSYQEAWRKFWEKLDDEERYTFLNLPGFDKAVFKEITGFTVVNEENHEN